jgi:CO/xanthine dehydrogenase FAD-binding subunit
MDLPVRQLLRPATLDEALRLLAASDDARPLAGGTDLVVQLRGGRLSAGTLVDLSMCGLEGIRPRDGGLEIGACTSMDRIASDDLVRFVCPSLAEAAAQVGAWPIQCRATLGGNLGNASPAADTAPPLLVCGATVLCASASGTREIAIDRLFTGPGAHELAGGELIVGVFVPEPIKAPGERVVERFFKVGPRREQILSTVSLAARIRIAADRRIVDVRLALGSVAPTPVRAHQAEAALEGKRADPEVIASACIALQHDIAPIDDVRGPARYRRIAAAVLLDRFLRGIDHA